MTTKKRINSDYQIAHALNAFEGGTPKGERAMTCGSKNNYIVLDKDDNIIRAKVDLVLPSVSKFNATVFPLFVVTSSEGEDDEGRMRVLRSAASLRVAQKVFNDMCSNYDMTLFPMFVIAFDKLLYKFRGNKEVPLEEPPEEEDDEEDVEDFDEEEVEEFVETIDEVNEKPKEGVGSEDVDTVKDVKEQVKEEIEKKIDAPESLVYESSFKNFSPVMANNILSIIKKGK